MQSMRHGGGISGRAERTTSPRNANRAGDTGPPAKPKLTEAWPQVWQLIRPRRWLLALGFVLMIINRICGLVLPAASKPFVDGVLSKRHGHLLLPIIAVVLTATADSGLHLVRAHAVALQGGAAHDRRTAPEGAATHRAAVGQFLRREPHRRAGVAHHDRRRGRAQPDRHRTGGLCRRHHHRADRVRGADEDQPHDHAHHLHRDPSVRHAAAEGAARYAADLPRARQDQRRSHRAADRVTGRRAGGEGLPCRGPRGVCLLRRRAAPAGQRDEVDDADVGAVACLDRRGGHDGLAGHVPGRTAGAGQQDHDRRLCRVHDVPGLHGGSDLSGSECRHAAYRGDCRPGPHRRNFERAAGV